MPRTSTTRRPSRARAAAHPPVATTAGLLEEPASLTQVPTKGAARCPVCSGSRLTRIALVLTDGSPVDFTSCHTCEHKSWVQEGSDLPFDKVLSKARKPR
jgi:hypothetical protein